MDEVAMHGMFHTIDETEAAPPRAAAAPPARPLIRLRSVSKDYHRGKVVVPVLDRFDLDIAPGAFVALMGSSGCGKTTLLNLVGGLDRPSAGEIMVGDVPIGRLGAAALAAWRAVNVAFVFQFYNLLPALSAAANVELPLLLQRLSRAERRRRVDSALEIVGLRDRSRHRPDELSGGQQQRVAIARAIVADPAVLLCDEPTGDLDRASAVSIMETLKLLNEEFGKTILLATHDADAAAYADRTIEMSRSRPEAGDLE